MNRSVESNRANCICRRTIRSQCHRPGELSPSLKIFSGNRTSAYQIRGLDECFLERRLTNSIELNRGTEPAFRFPNGSCLLSFLLSFLPPRYLLSASNRRCSFRENKDHQRPFSKRRILCSCFARQASRLDVEAKPGFKALRPSEQRGRGLFHRLSFEPVRMDDGRRPNTRRMGSQVRFPRNRASVPLLLTISRVRR